MLSIDEAINILKSDNDYNKSIGCDTSYEEQLAEWLEELKALRNGLKIKCDSLNDALEKGKKIGYNKAIDDFAEKIKSNYRLGYVGYLDKIVDEIAEQLKAGG